MSCHGRHFGRKFHVAERVHTCICANLTSCRLAEDYNLEMQYRKSFTDVWAEEKDDPILGLLSEKMGVREQGRGPLLVSEEEMEAASKLSSWVMNNRTFTDRS